MENEKSFPKRKNPRARKFDYRTPGFYFITINAIERGTDLFGSLTVDPENGENDAVRAGHRAGPCFVTLTPIGEIIEHCIEEIDGHYANARVDIYAIMPDHVHMILQLYSVENGPARCPALTADLKTEPNTRKGMEKGASVIDIMGAFKALAAMKAGRHIWQRSFFDHYIRNDTDLYNARRYVAYNASKHFLNQEEGHDTHA